MKIVAGLSLILILSACKSAPQKPSFGKKDGSNQTPGDPDNPRDPDDPNNPDNPTGGVDGEVSVGFNTALPRLTHDEWENSVKDVFLLNEKPGLAGRFAADGDSTLFRNDSDVNKLSTNLAKNYSEASEEIGKRISTNADIMKKLIPANAPAGESLARATAIVGPIATRAYRRPLTKAELEGLSNIYANAKKLLNAQNFDAAGLQLLAAALIQSPQFIYRPELGEKEDKFAKLSPYEVASRLSYALWKTIPDEELQKAAASGALATEEGIKKQVDRMMNDPRSTQTLKFFIQEIFETKKFVNIKKDNKMFPNFPNDLGDTLKREAEMFIDDVVIKNDGGLNQLLTANYTFVNDKTAPLYGVNKPNSNDLTKVNLDPKQRAGLITSVGWLAYNASENRTSAIHRGFFVLNRIACDELPPMFGSDMANNKEFKTRRDELEFKTGSCGAQCHNNYINPPAFALEAFDASGAYRTMENGNPIDTSGVYGLLDKNFPNKDKPTKFANAVELMKGIANRTSTHECLIGRSIELLYNRRVNPSDQEIMKRLGAESKEGLGIKKIFAELVSDMALNSQRSDNK